MSTKMYRIDLVALHITAACGHRCPFCYMAEVREERPRHPPIEVLQQIVNRLSEAGVREVTFLGGDPAIYPSVVELASYCVSKGLTVCSMCCETKRTG